MHSTGYLGIKPILITNEDALAKLEQVWGMADLFLGIMALTNLAAITLLSNKAFKCLLDFARQKKEKKDPVFTIRKIEEYDGAECWQGNKV